MKTTFNDMPVPAIDPTVQGITRRGPKQLSAIPFTAFHWSQTPSMASRSRTQNLLAYSASSDHEQHHLSLQGRGGERSGSSSPLIICNACERRQHTDIRNGSLPHVSFQVRTMTRTKRGFLVGQCTLSENGNRNVNPEPLDQRLPNHCEAWEKGQTQSLCVKQPNMHLMSLQLQGSVQKSIDGISRNHQHLQGDFSMHGVSFQ